MFAQLRYAKRHPEQKVDLDNRTGNPKELRLAIGASWTQQDSEDFEKFIGEPARAEYLNADLKNRQSIEALLELFFAEYPRAKEETRH